MTPDEQNDRIRAQVEAEMPRPIGGFENDFDEAHWKEACDRRFLQLCNPPTKEDRMITFQQGKARGSILFCVRCGSTNLDQNTQTEIMCYACGNTVPWDSSRFSVARATCPDADAEQSFEDHP